MNRKLGGLYWMLVLALQIFLIGRKVSTDGFYLWNGAALIAAIYFLYTRFLKEKVAVTNEIVITLFLGINGITSFLAQMMRLESYLIMTGGITVGAISFFMTYYIRKTEKPRKIAEDTETKTSITTDNQ